MEIIVLKRETIACKTESLQLIKQVQDVDHSPLTSDLEST